MWLYGQDICRLLQRCLELWLQGNVEMLIQEAEHCNQALHWSRHSVVDDETVIRIFTKLMLCGKVKAAIRWAMERTRVCFITFRFTWWEFYHQLWIFCTRSIQPHLLIFFIIEVWTSSSLGGCWKSHVLCSACRIQGGAGPGGCDSCRWCVVLLRYGAHSA